MNFDDIKDNDRVWVFPSPGKLSEEVQKSLIEEISRFCAGWQAHGKQLRSSVQIIDNHFIVISVDESFENASGCSIDSMMHFMLSLEKSLGHNLSDRSRVYFQDNDENVFSLDFLSAKNKIKEGLIPINSITFNTAASRGNELKKLWKSKLNDSWMGKFVPNPVNSQ